MTKSLGIKTLANVMLLLGAVLLFGPLYGIVITVYGMIETFNTVTVNGTGGSLQLSQGISTALTATQWGLMICVF
ncbi:MAG: MotA/TolQ/ExbB proton channel family protein, partial [Verrucomicrobiota bacterium]